jgi:hypothetical protein
MRFKAFVVVEGGIIHFLQDVSLEEVSKTPDSPILTIKGPFRRVTNTYLRCRHEVQLVSLIVKPLLPSSADMFVCFFFLLVIARGRSEWLICVEDYFIAKPTTSLRFGAKVAIVGLALHTRRAASLRNAKELVINCELFYFG